MLKQMGCVLDFEIVKEGFYPKGGGIAKLQIQPVCFIFNK